MLLPIIGGVELHSRTDSSDASALTRGSAFFTDANGMWCRLQVSAVRRIRCRFVPGNDIVLWKFAFLVAAVGQTALPAGDSSGCFFTTTRPPRSGHNESYKKRTKKNLHLDTYFVMFSLKNDNFKDII